MIFMPVNIFEAMKSKSDEASAVPSHLDSPTWLSSKEREQQEIIIILPVFSSACFY